VAALCDMGYDRRNVEEKIALLSQEMQASGSFEGKTKEEKEQILFRQAIVALA